MSDISDLSKVSLKAIEYAKSVLHDGTVIQSQSDEFDFLNYDDTQNIEGKEKYALIKARVNQGIIRKKALKKYSSKCVLCNMGFEPSLIASHIKEWTFSDNSEKGDLDNILLFLASIYALITLRLLYLSTSKTISLYLLGHLPLTISKVLLFNLSLFISS